MDPLEKAFGKAPETGYDFKYVDIELVDSGWMKGFLIKWGAAGVGFGQVFVGWGIDMEYLKEYPKQQGFHSDTEYMSDEFIQALMKEAAPKLAEIIINGDKDNVR